MLGIMLGEEPAVGPIAKQVPHSEFMVDACYWRGIELKQPAIIGPGWQQRNISIARFAVGRLGGIEKASPTVFQVDHGEFAGQRQRVVRGKSRSLPVVV